MWQAQRFQFTFLRAHDYYKYKNEKIIQHQ